MSKTELSKQERVDVVTTAYGVPIRCLRESRNLTLRSRKPTQQDQMGFAIWDDIIDLLISERELAITLIEAGQ